MKQDLKRELASGVFYTAVAKYSGIATQLIVMAVLSRMLTPADFGIVAVATVFISFFNILSDIGIGPAVVQNKTLTSYDLNQIFSFTLYMGILMAILFFLCSGPIAYYYKNESLANVCRYLSLSIFFYSLNIVPNSILLKKKEFRFIAVRTLGVQLFTGFISVLAAFFGMGLYTLLLSPILSSILIFFINYKRAPLCLRMVIDTSSLKKISSFSIYQFLFNFINYFSRNLDKLLVGHYLGLVSLGYYEKSYRLMMMPLQNITFVISPVLHPILSTLQNNYKELASKYMKILELLAYISFPLSVCLYFTATELIILIFGKQWYEAIRPFEILSLSVSVQILTSTAGSIYQSANATKLLFVSGLCCAFLLITGFLIPIIVYRTIEAVAWGFLISQIANTLQTFYLLFHKLEYPLMKVYLMLLKPFLLGVSLFIILTLYTYFIKIDNLYISLLMKLILCLGFTLFVIQQCKIYNLLSFLKKKMGKC